MLTFAGSKLRKKFHLRIISSFLPTILFVHNCVLAHAAETNFWAERSSFAKATEDKKRSEQFAGLPTVALATVGLQNQLPEAKSRIKETTLSRSFLNKFSKNDQSILLPIFKSLPSSYGTVRKISPLKNGKVDRVIIHFQDVHLNAEAQENIGKSLQSLISNKQIDLVALEGAFSPLDLAPFRQFPHQDTVHKVADYLLKENKISGPVHAAFTSSSDIPPFVGIDDAKHYHANVEAYQQSSVLVKGLKTKLLEREKDLTQEKITSFNPSLMAFDSQVEAYRAGKIQMGEYARILAKDAEGLSPELETFLEALKLESSLNFSQVEAERSILLANLLKKLSKTQTSDLMTHSVAYRLGNLPHTDFYEYLKNLCEKSGVNLSQFPAMNSYIQYVLLSDNINTEAVFKEIQELEQSRYLMLSKMDREKHLIEESKYLYLVGKLLDFGLTKDEWEEYKTFNSSFPNVLVGDDDLKSFESFYREAEARDLAMTQNLLKAMEERNAKVAVLVTGGFHSGGMQKIAQDSGLTTITFVPKITKVESEKGSGYLSVFAQEKTPLEKLFSGEKLFLNPPQYTPNLRATASLMIQAEEARLGRGVQLDRFSFGNLRLTGFMGVKEGIRLHFKDLKHDASLVLVKFKNGDFDGLPLVLTSVLSFSSGVALLRWMLIHHINGFPLLTSVVMIILSIAILFPHWPSFWKELIPE